MAKHTIPHFIVARLNDNLAIEYPLLPVSDGTREMDAALLFTTRQKAEDFITYSGKPFTAVRLDYEHLHDWLSDYAAEQAQVALVDVSGNSGAEPIFAFKTDELLTALSEADRTVDEITAEAFSLGY